MKDFALGQRHHWVPASYLSAWAGKDGLLAVTHRDSAGTQKFFRKSPKRFYELTKRGYYDLPNLNGRENKSGSLESALLEKVMFAQIDESLFLKKRIEFLDQGIIPSYEEVKFFGTYCLNLFYRGPKYQKMADIYFADSSLEKPLLGNHAVRTSVNALLSWTRIDRFLFKVIDAGSSRFLTSDTPSWFWIYTGGLFPKRFEASDPLWYSCFRPKVFVPLRNLLEWKEMSLTGIADHTRMICPLSPRYVLQVILVGDAAPVTDDLANHPKLTVEQADEEDIDSINAMIASSSDRFTISPPRD